MLLLHIDCKIFVFLVVMLPDITVHVSDYFSSEKKLIKTLSMCAAGQQHGVSSLPAAGMETAFVQLA